MSSMGQLRALLVKAQDIGCTKSEAEEALKLAQKIAVKLNVSVEDMLKDNEKSKSETPDVEDLLTIVTETFILEGGMSRIGHPANHLFESIVRAVSIRCINMHPDSVSVLTSLGLIDADARDTKVIMIGPERLVNLVQMVYKIIRSAMDTEWPKAQAKEKAKKRRNFAVRISKKDFQTGMREQFDTELYDARIAIRKQMTVLQLIMHDKVQNRLNDMIQSKYNVIPASFDNRSGASGSSAYEAGRKAAAKYNVGEIVSSTALNKQRLG